MASKPYIEFITLYNDDEIICVFVPSDVKFGLALKNFETLDDLIKTFEYNTDHGDKAVTAALKKLVKSGQAFEINIEDGMPEGGIYVMKRYFRGVTYSQKSK